jgi:hypothetical protein
MRVTIPERKCKCGKAMVASPKTTSGGREITILYLCSSCIRREFVTINNPNWQPVTQKQKAKFDPDDPGYEAKE